MTPRKRSEAAKTVPIPTGGGPVPARFWRATQGLRRWYVTAADLGKAMASLAVLIPEEAEAIVITSISASAARKIPCLGGETLATAPMGTVRELFAGTITAETP